MIRPSQLPPSLLAQIKKLLLQNRKVEAVKVCLEATDLGLKQSKDLVDTVAEEMKIELTHR